MPPGPFAPFTPSKGAAAPFAGAQKQAAQKVAAAKAKLPLPYLSSPAGKASTARAAASNRFNLGLEQAKIRQQTAANERRLGFQIHPQPSPSARPAPAHHGGGGILGAIESGAGDVAGALGGAAKGVGDVLTKGFHDAYPQGVSPAEARALRQRGTPVGRLLTPERNAAGIAPGPAMVKPIDVGSFISGLGTAAKNTPSSTVHTITGIIPGIYDTGKAAVNAAKGHPGELEQIGKGLAHVVLHPWTSFQQNPVGTGLMFAAPGEALGRGLGAVARSGALGDRAAELASMDRASLLLYGRSTGASTDQIGAGLHDVSIPRTYSPNVIRKGGQVAAEKIKEGALGQHPNMATGEQTNRYLYGGGLLGQHVFKRVQGFFKPGLVDKQAATGEAIRRLYTQAAAHYLKEIKPKVGAEAVPLAVEGILRRPETVVADLNKELARLAESAKGLTGRELRLNKANQTQIQGLLADKKFLAEPQHAFEAARQYTDWSRPHEERLVQLGHLEPDQLHARLVPYAIAHMKAAYNENPGKHPLVAGVASAKRAVRSAEKAVQRSRGRLEGRLLPSTIQPVTGWHQALQDATMRLSNARGAHARLAQDLQQMKAAGFIKNDGSMWPRLERGGEHLHSGEIEAHMRQNLGDRGVGFLTHKADQSYGKALESYPGKRPGTEIHSRTGVSFSTGTYKRDYAALHLQAYRHMNAIAGHENRDEMLRRFGIGRFHEPQDAQRALDNFAHTPEGDAITKALGTMTVQRIGPDRVVDRGNVQTRLASPVLRDYALAEHKAMNETMGAPKYTLMPDVVAKRISEHDKLNQTSPGLKALQWYTNKWRSAALFTSPRWLLGNPQEHAIRLAMASINPAALFGAGKAVRLGNDLLDQWRSIAVDPARTEAERYAARAHTAAWEAGTHYGSVAMNAVRRKGTDVMEPGLTRDLSEMFDETAGVAHAAAGWARYKGIIGQGMARVERNTKAALLGKAALNETRKFSGEWKALLTRQGAAVRKYAEGKLSPNESAKLGNDILEMSGNWSQLTPFVRRAVQTYSPFGLWWLTSMKFVFQTLPKDHPFKTAALAAMEAGTGVAGKQAGQPAYLQGGIGVNLPIVGKVTLTPGYYSPFGVGVEPNVTAAEQIGPQFSDPLLTTLGVNPATHREIPGVPPGDLAMQALYSAISGAIPGARQALQLAEQGGKHDYKSLNPAAIKPGSARGLGPTLFKMLSPVKMTLGRREGGGAGREVPLGREVPVKEVPVKEVPVKTGSSGRKPPYLPLARGHGTAA